MLTINAQYTPRQRVGFAGETQSQLLLFVADASGERIFEAPGCLTLEAIEAGGGFISGATLAHLEAFQACEEFCGDREYWISPAVWEALGAYRSEILDSLWRS